MSGKYRALISQLYEINMYNPVKLGLQNMMQLSEMVGNPLINTPIIHIAGTNGKGSVAVKISRALSAMGFKTGLYTSPHISSFRERIQVDSKLISEEEIERNLPRLFDICQQQSIPATFFEVTTALAMMHFEEQKCDAVVLEVGIGGRLDATNIVTPVLSIITSIQMDHMNMLGDTIDKIAVEKAGIIKPNKDIIMGPQCPRHVIEGIAIERNAPFHTINDILLPTQRKYIPDSTAHSDTDDINTDLALAALELIDRKQLLNHPQKKIQVRDYLYMNTEDNDKELTKQYTSILRSRLPCRFEQLIVTINNNQKLHVILDMAHNIDGIQALDKRLQVFFPNANIRVIFAMSADKDSILCVESILHIVQNDYKKVYCTAAKHPRALAPNKLRDNFQQYAGVDDIDSRRNDGDIRTTIHKAIQDIITTTKIDQLSSEFITEDYHSILDNSNHGCDNQEKGNILVICGTAFIMSEVRYLLGVQEPRDSDFDEKNANSEHRDIQENFGPTKP